MPGVRCVSDEPSAYERGALARIAYRYYVDGLTQLEIGRELGLSRPKVQRLLDRAREMGIVEVRIHSEAGTSPALESRLRSSFRLKDAIVALAQPGPKLQREAVARAAASYLVETLGRGAVVAVGMGRNTSELARFVDTDRRLGWTFVSAMGGSPSVDAPTDPNEICRVLADRTGGRVESLFAPAYVESSRLRDRLVAQEAVAHGLRIARSAALAIVGVGGTDDGCTMVRSGCCPAEEMIGLRARGAVGDVLGNYFDRSGQIIRSRLQGRLVGLTLDDLRAVGTVMAVVGETDKLLAVLGALRTGVLDVLAVDEVTAARLIEMASGPLAAGAREPGQMSA
jgi:DNA-binding transcriptional regulator LsrR (DeoR family)